MISIEDTSFHGLPAQTVASPHLRVTYLTGEGPRIVGLYLPGDGRNFLAELPAFSFDTPYGPNHLRGGHRLWAAPETWPQTQIPDDQQVTVEPLPNGGGPIGVRLTGGLQPDTLLRKSLDLHLDAGRPQLRLVHRLENLGPASVILAAWGITMLPLGGVALLPQHTHPLDGNGLLPNRLLALWPYTRLDDPRLSFDTELWQVRAVDGASKLKIGCLNVSGWAAYVQSRRVLVKRFAWQAGASYPDLGSNCEVYIDPYTLELESLGPLVTLQPGESAEHLETWECFASPDDPHLPAGLHLALDRMWE